MSYMIATPAALTAAATDIDGIGSAVSVANAAAVAATTGVLAAGGMKCWRPSLGCSTQTPRNITPSARRWRRFKPCLCAP